MRQSVKDYWYYKTEGNRKNVPVLFLHGFMGSCWDWDNIIEKLANKYFCISVDLPGHGRTRIFSGEHPYTMSGAAQGIIKILNELKLKQVISIGYSMGGRLALYLLLKYSERFSAVVMESASPGLEKTDERIARQQHDKLLARTLMEYNFRDFLTEWYNQPLFKSLKSRQDFPQLFNRRLDNNPGNLAKALLNMGTGKQPSLWGELKHNKIPLLLLAGEFDIKFRKIGAGMVEVCEKANFIEVAGCGHIIHFENPEAFVHHIKIFFTELKEKSHV